MLLPLAASPDTDRPFLIATGNSSIRSLVIENFEFAVAVLGVDDGIYINDGR